MYKTFENWVNKRGKLEIKEGVKFCIQVVKLKVHVAVQFKALEIIRITIEEIVS